MKFFYSLKSVILVLLTLFITNFAYAELKVDVAFPKGYRLDSYKTIGNLKLDDAESIVTYPNSFICNSALCGGQNDDLRGFSMVVDHKFASVALIGGAAWFNIVNSDNQYLASCQLIAYSEGTQNVPLEPVVQLFCYTQDNINNLQYPWSIAASYLNNDMTNPHIQVYFAPAVVAEDEYTTMAVDVTYGFMGLNLETSSLFSKLFTTYFQYNPGSQQDYAELNFQIPSDLNQSKSYFTKISSDPLLK